MNCEICGTEIKGQPYKTKIDNSVMITCKECSSYGKVQSTPGRENSTDKKNSKNKRKKQGKRTYQRAPKAEYELVDDYEKLIKQTRERKRLTHKQLAEKIYEKESVIAHIETGKMVPDDKISRKLEKILNIKLIEKMDNDEREFRDSRRFREATIGDIARIKRK